MAGTAGALGWGAHYVAVEPSHFRIDYAINPFMDPSVQPDPERAMRQWRAMVTQLRGLGARVDVIDQVPEAPDMVYAMNLGLGYRLPRESAETEQRVLMSHMRFPQRRIETPAAQSWFNAQGWTVDQTDERRPHFEAGDAFAFGDALLVGYGPRTEGAALGELARTLNTRVRGFRITHPGMYHLDLAFCPLDQRRALVCPDALDEESAAELMRLIPEPIVLTEAEALGTFAANSVVVGDTIVMPDCPVRIRQQLEHAGFDVVIVDVSEFHLGGGSIRCLTNPVDLVMGRDLPLVPGGEVILPAALSTAA